MKDNLLAFKNAFLIAAVIALVTFGASVSMLSSPDTGSSEQDGNRPDPQATQMTPELERQIARAKFYDSQVVPLIAEVDAENRAAAERCLQRIEQVMGGYHDGVDEFVEDLTSLSTRLGVLKRMPAGWWADDGRVEAYVQDKFETHLFSEQSLVDDLSCVLFQFRDDVSANQTRMLIQLKAALTTADLPGVVFEPHDDFFRDLSKGLGKYAAHQGSTSVENMLGALVLGEVGAFAARSVIAGLLTRFAPSVVIGSAAGASATAGASAAGAGGGSIGGPIGAAVGFGAGLAVGLIIDWWMTERFEAELSRQMHLYLYDLESTLISGQTNSSKATTPESGEQSVGAQVGLKSGLEGLCDSLRVAYRDRFFELIVDGESSR